jgi:hypothetical protein
MASGQGLTGYSPTQVDSLAYKQVTYMASETTKGAIKPSSEQLDALAQFVRENMELVLSPKSGQVLRDHRQIRSQCGIWWP